MPDAGSWRPSASLDMLRRRAALLTKLRRHMDEAGFLEVETPLLSRAGSPELHLDSLHVPRAFPDAAPGWLITSPEFHLKRLLAAGGGDLYSIARVFRAGESGRLHNPEFTLVEWYRTGAGLERLLDDIAVLLAALLPPALHGGSAERLSYRAAFERHADLDPFHARLASLQEVAEMPQEEDRDVLLDRIAATRVYPRLGRGHITLVYAFPASQASLARVRAGTPPVAERVEAIVAGVELVNGFVELVDAAEQRRRFEADLERRLAAGRERPFLDERFLGALAAELPPCVGAALGFDRLAMLALGAERLDQVIAFPEGRA